MTPEEEAVLLAEQAADRTPQYRAAVLAKARALRTVIFARLDGIQASNVTKALTDPGNATAYTTLAQAIETAKQGMRDLTTTVDFTGCTDVDQMEGKVTLAYKAITGPAPLAVKMAFAGLDQ